MRAWLAAGVVALVAFAAANISAEGGETALIVDGEIATPVTLSQDAFAALPHTTITAKDHDGHEHRYGGVDMSVVLERAGAPLGDKLRGPEARKFLSAQGSDNYVAVFSFPEFRPGAVLIADAADGQPLTTDGPLRLVVPADATHSRWVRNLVRLSVRKD